MTRERVLKPVGFLILVCLAGCAKVTAEPVKVVTKVVVKQPEPARSDLEPVKTEAEIEAESYALGDYWWAERLVSEEEKSNANRDRWINKLLPRREFAKVSTKNVSSNALDLAKKLRNGAGHESYYWVKDIYGDKSSNNVVVLVPQYHRATGLPILWSSLGDEVATVQGNLQYLIEDLVESEGLECLGLEGSGAKRVTRSTGLDRSVSWAQRLRGLFQKILYQAALEDSRLVPAAQTILESLEPYFARYVRWQDGVGAALANLGSAGEKVHRFGLEDEQLVLEAEALHLKLRGLKEKLMISSKPDRGELAIRDMWLSEYPDFRDGFLLPIEESFGELRRVLIRLRREGAVDEARLIGKFLGQVRVLMDQVVAAKEVERYFDYYRDQFGKNAGKAGATSRADRKLNKRIGVLEKKYQRVVMKSRERVAATRVLEAMKASNIKTCAVVMGAGHEKGLIKALLKQSKKLGVVVVRPFSH